MEVIKKVNALNVYCWSDVVIKSIVILHDVLNFFITET